MGELPVVLSANERWLAGYRRERVNDSAAEARTSDVVGHSPGISLRSLADEVGQPILVLPTIFHMLWRQELVAELSQHTLSLRTRIYPGHRA
jgi:hypothetical protein